MRQKWISSWLNDRELAGQQSLLVTKLMRRTAATRAEFKLSRPTAAWTIHSVPCLRHCHFALSLSLVHYAVYTLATASGFGGRCLLRFQTNVQVKIQRADGF